MSHHPLQTFGRSDVSEKERRFVRFAGPESMGPLPRGRATPEQREGWRNISVSDYSGQRTRAIGDWNERETGRRSIPSAPQLAAEYHLASARTRGAVVEGNYIDGTPARIKAERDARFKILFAESDQKVNVDISLMRKEIAYGLPTWQMTYFHELPLEGKQRAIVNAVNRGEDVPDIVFKHHGLDRDVVSNRSAAKSAEVFVSADRAAPGGFRPRSPETAVRSQRTVAPDSGDALERYEERSARLQDYIRDQDQKLDAEIASTLQYATVLRDGPQKAALMAIVQKYRAMREQWGESVIEEGQRIEDLFGSKGKDIDGKTNQGSLLDISEELRKAVQRVPGHAQAEFARQMVFAGRARIDLPKMVNGLEAEVQAVIEQSKQGTSEKMAEFIVLRRKWDAVEGTDLRPEAIRAVGEELIKSIDALGSHLFVNHVWENTTEEENAAFITDVQQRLAAKGVSTDDGEDFEFLTPDHQGMRNLLVAKNGVLQKLCENQEDDVMLRRRHVVALARTQRAFIENGGSRDDIQDIIGKRTIAEHRLASMSKELTEQAIENFNPAIPEQGLAAAQRERFILEELPATPDVEERLKELKRSPEALGIIGEECNKVLGPLRAATDALVMENLTTSVGCIDALKIIRAEGSMLWKLQSDLNPEVVASRLDALVKMQWEIIEKRWQIERGAAGDNPQKISEAIVASARELNKPALAAFEQTLANEARALRTPVNAAIEAARNEKILTVPTVKKAVEMIAAETVALRALGIDPERITSIQKELTLLDVLDTQVIEAVKVGTQSAPDLAKFQQMSKLLHDEDVMVRAVFRADPARLASRVAAIEQRREALMKAFNVAVDTAVKNLDEKTSTSADVEKASELLEEAFHQKGGNAMPDVQELGRMNEMRKKVEMVRAAVVKREGNKSTTEAPAPAAPTSAPASNAKDVNQPSAVDVPPSAPVEGSNAAPLEVPDLSPPSTIERPSDAPMPEAKTVTPKVKLDEAALERFERLQPDEAVTTEAVTASMPNVTIEPLVPKPAEALSPLRREIDASRQLLEEVRNTADTRMIEDIQEQLLRMQGASDDTSPEDYSSLEEGLSKKLQDLLMLRGSDDDVRKAARIFAGRFGQLKLDEDQEIDRLLARAPQKADSGLTRTQLLAELDDKKGILRTAIDRKMEDVSYPLADIRRKLLSTN